MAVVSGYSVELYCDCKSCHEYRSLPYAYSTTEGHGEFGGETFRECIGYAKSAGWVFKERNTVCFAPGHGVIKYKD